MSWRTEIFSGHWADRGCVFATRQEAISYGAQLTHIDRRPYRTVESTDAVNQAWQVGGLRRVKPNQPRTVWEILNGISGP